MDAIKIITINTWKCDGDYHTRMRLLAKQLLLLEPHIIACQECFMSEAANADTLKFIAEHLNMRYTFLPGRSKQRQFKGAWVDSQSGLGILSAYPMSDITHFTLPAATGDDERKAQQAVLNLPSGKTVLVTNTHLTHLSSSDREKQAEALAGFVINSQAHDCHLVCGDFNATINSPEINAFKNRTKAVDCYAEGKGAEPRYSLLEAFKVNKMICVDHIFALAKDTKKYPEFVNSEIVLNSCDSLTGIYPSDHFGIAATLII